MLVDFSKITFTADNKVEHPQLLLKTLFGSPIGYLGLSYNLTCVIRYNDVSEIEFDYPAAYEKNGAMIDAPGFDRLTGMTIVDMQPYGQFLLMKPEDNNSGIKHYKHCHGYSLEYELNNKQIYMESGTYNFYNPADHASTLLGIVMELIPNWSIGTVPDSLIGKYRTFDDVNQNLYSFLMNTIQSTYHCLFIFDSSARTINIVDADTNAVKAPIYLSFDNLLKSTKIEELSDQIVTCLSAYGADPVSIRSVNPMGTNKLYNLDWFIEAGNFPSSMVSKWQAWKANFETRQSLYSNLVVEYNIELANYTSEQASLTTLNEELNTLEQLQSVAIEGISAGTSTQDDLDEINDQIASKKSEISDKENDIETSKSNLDSISNSMAAINSECAFSAFFTDEEIKILNPYFKEETITDNTFVISTVDYSNNNVSRNLADYTVAISATDTGEISVDESLNKRLFDFRGGTISISNGVNNLSADIKNMTFEVKETNEFLFTCCLNAITDLYDETTKEYASADLSLKGILSNFSVSKGAISFGVDSAICFLQFGATEYQQISVEKELYDYAKSILDEKAYPAYEFSIESGNIIFAKDFKPFKDSLQLGKAVYLSLDNRNIVYPILLELHIDYEKPDSFSMVFSDEYRVKQGNELVDLIGKSVTTSNSVDFNKYNYSAYKDSNAENEVKKFIDGTFDAVKNRIVSSSDINVDISGSGISCCKWNDEKTGFLPQQMRIINNEIAMTDDGWNSVKLAIGQFTDKNTGTHFGVNSGIIAGTALIGSNLVLEADTLYDGVAQFKFDSSGAFLNNSRMYLQASGGRIGIDPNYGIIGGTANLFQITSTGAMRPSCIDDDGNLILDGDGFPKDTNFWTGIRTGDVYLRGKIVADSGFFRGIVQASDFQDHSGNSMLTSDGKFDSSYLDLGNIQLNGETGDITMTGNINLSSVSSINWGSNTPVQYQFSVDGASNWHPVMTVSDKYRKDSLDGGLTWGDAYQFVGTNGKNGSDANVNWANIKTALKSASALTDSIITIDSVGSPNIYGGNIYGCNIYAGDGEDSFAKMSSDGLAIYQSDAETPKAQLYTGNNGSVVALMLGDGDGPAAIADRFSIIKRDSKTTLQYNGDPAYNKSGFQFNDDGTIDVIGTLNGVVAVFGD